LQFCPVLPVLKINFDALFSDFAAPLQDPFAAPGAEPEFFVSDTGQIFFNFMARNCAFWSSLTLTHS